MLTVLVEGGGADSLQLSPGQQRLEDRRRVNRPLGCPGTHQGVDLVDEKDDVAAGPDLLENLLEALLEVAPITASGHQSAQIKGVELLSSNRLGDVPPGHHLGQALDDGRLAHARFADQHRIVLGSTGEDLHDPLQFALPSDDRVQLLLGGREGEVAAELVKDQRSGRAVSAATTRGGPGLLARLGAAGTGAGVAGQ